MNKIREHYHLIDAFRGLALVNMLLFHFCYDYFIIFRDQDSWYYHPTVCIWQQFICISFLFIAGISWHFSHRHIRRGILLNLCGFAITAVTLVFIPSQAVRFGILNCMGCCLLLFCLLEPFCLKIKAGAGLFTSLFLFLLFRHISSGILCLGFPILPLIRLPDFLYHFRPMVILGFPYPQFSSSDYFPLLPWFFLFTAGYFFWRLIEGIDGLRSFFLARVPLLSPLGRRTLVIYLLHQPILYTAAFLLASVR